MFTEGCFVLVEGDYTEDEVFQVIAMGHPPSEKRAVARYGASFRCILFPTLMFPYRSIYGHIDFLGKGATTVAEDVSANISPNNNPAHARSPPD